MDFNTLQDVAIPMSSYPRTCRMCEIFLSEVPHIKLPSNALRGANPIVPLLPKKNLRLPSWSSTHFGCLIYLVQFRLGGMENTHTSLLQIARLSLPPAHFRPYLLIFELVNIFFPIRMVMFFDIICGMIDIMFDNKAYFRTEVKL